MNEIRMYVEHLFEGRMLTAENIELKEEIYGNLVARYEDYVAGGMDPAEALEKTKASMSSIDDVIEGIDDARETGRADNGDVAKVDTAETTVLPNAAVAKGAFVRATGYGGRDGYRCPLPVSGASGGDLRATLTKTSRAFPSRPQTRRHPRASALATSLLQRLRALRCLLWFAWA